MPHTTHMPTPEDDGRHTPGPDALPLWNESYWFPFYDPQQEIGVVFRVGSYPNQKQTNLFLFVTHKGTVVHSLVDMRAAVPAMEDRRLGIHGLQLEWEEPLERFRMLKIQVDGVMGTDQQPAKPFTLMFELGG